MSTSLSATIMEFLNNIFGDETERAAFLANPEGVLAAHGLEDLSCADFDDAMVSFFDNERGDNNLGGTFTNTVRHDGENDHEAIARHLTTVVKEEGDNYYTITNNDNDTVYDSSFQGTVIAGDDVNFDNDTTIASGDGAVAAGDDINGPTNTGDIDADQSGINFGQGSTATGGNETTTTTNDNDEDNDTTFTDNSEENDTLSLSNSGNDSSNPGDDNNDNSNPGDDDNELNEGGEGNQEVGV